MRFVITNSMDEISNRLDNLTPCTVTKLKPSQECEMKTLQTSDY